MAIEPLTVIVKIKSGEENALQEILKIIAGDLSNNPYLRLAQSPLTHVARFGILNDSNHGLRLLFTSNFDGSLEIYIQELLQLGESEAIWNKCEGYRGRGEFLDFILEHSYKAQAAFTALPDETVASIRQKVALRQQLESLLDRQDINIASFIDTLSQVPPHSPWWRKLGASISQFIAALGKTIDDLGRDIRELLVTILQFVGGILGAPEQNRQVPEYTGVRIDNDRLKELTSAEEINELNHLHLLSTVRPGRLLRLRIVLFLINFAGRNLFAPGTLADIQSIHFAHWSIVDGGKHLLFVTNYDGSFDNYLGDFSDRASVGLNSIWNNVEGYPVAGAQFDLVAFKQFFRNDQQPPSLVFYRAYSVTVKNILRDRQIIDPLATHFDRQATEDWLENL
jgi:hypothetical protein